MRLSQRSLSLPDPDDSAPGPSRGFRKAAVERSDADTVVCGGLWAQNMPWYVCAPGARPST